MQWEKQSGAEVGFNDEGQAKEKGRRYDFLPAFKCSKSSSGRG